VRVEVEVVERAVGEHIEGDVIGRDKARRSASSVKSWRVEPSSRDNVARGIGAVIVDCTVASKLEPKWIHLHLIHNFRFRKAIGVAI